MAQQLNAKQERTYDSNISAGTTKAEVADIVKTAESKILQAIGLMKSTEPTASTEITSR